MCWRNFHLFVACIFPALIGRSLWLGGAIGLFCVSAWAQSGTADGFALTMNNPGAPPVDAPKRVPVFFPPAPPILGAALPNPTFVDLRLRPPAELAAFVSEPFYASLSTLYAEKQVSPKLQARLESFLAQRNLLEAELTARLAALGPLSPPDRERELAALRTAQAPALTACEEAAEQLRRDCREAGEDWSSLRRLLPADPTPAKDARRQELRRNALLSVAFYQNGLSPTQRDLLREAVALLEPESFSPERKIVCPPDRRTLFFLPGAVRVVIPTSLPEPLAAKVLAFEQAKEKLKRELIDAVEPAERALWHDRFWRKLGEKQASRLTDLETQAEELRRDFQQPAISFQPVLMPYLPPDFAGRFDRYRHAFDQVQLEFGQRLDARLRELLTYQPGSGAVKYRVVSSGAMGGLGMVAAGQPNAIYLHALQFLPPPDANENQQKLLAQLKPTADAFSSEHTAQAQALETERKALEAEFGKIISTSSKLPADQALALLLRIAAQADEWGRFSEYRQAVLLPGLSPAQRRLLLGLALRRLARPLAGGELM